MVHGTRWSYEYEWNLVWWSVNDCFRFLPELNVHRRSSWSPPETWIPIFHCLLDRWFPFCPFEFLIISPLAQHRSKHNVLPDAKALNRLSWSPVEWMCVALAGLSRTSVPANSSFRIWNDEETNWIVGVESIRSRAKSKDSLHGMLNKESYKGSADVFEVLEIVVSAVTRLPSNDNDTVRSVWSDRLLPER